jgi:hypothetical protein
MRAKYGWAESIYGVPDFEYVRDRASFDYLRDRVRVRTGKPVRGSVPEQEPTGLPTQIALLDSLGGDVRLPAVFAVHSDWIAHGSLPKMLAQLLFGERQVACRPVVAQDLLCD